MKEALILIPCILYGTVGVISLVMAFKCFLSNKFLAFHEKAANKHWNEIDKPLQIVILTILRLSGMGFLIVSILLIVCPVVNYIFIYKFYQFAIPLIALIFCTGLFVINYKLYTKSKAITPWKGSLYAMVAIIIGIITSILVK